jgi:hypothetical protein
MPGLTAQQDYDRDNLAADLGLARVAVSTPTGPTVLL